MFSGISSKVILIQFVLMLAMVGAGYWYFQHSQAVIAALHEDKAKLETAVKVQEETIAAQQAAAQRQNAENLRLQQSLSDAESRRRDLETTIRRRNLEAMARANSADLEQRMNRATVQAFRDIENITRPRDRPVEQPTSRPQGTQPTSEPSQASATPPPSVAQPNTAQPNTSQPSNIQPPPRPPRTSTVPGRS